MRITNNTIARNYTNNLNMNLKRLNDAHNKVLTGQRFNSFSESVSLGIRALRLRQDVAKNAVHIDNTKEMQGRNKTAQDSLAMIMDYSQNVTSKYVRAINGEMGDEEHDTYIKEFEKLRDGMLSTLNAQNSDRYMYGGTNVNTQPFRYDEATNKLYYTGGKGLPEVDVSTLRSTKPDPSDPIEDAKYAEYLKYIDDPSYVDIGLGLSMRGDLTDPAKEVIPSTAYNQAIVGLNITGVGEDNLITMIGDMITALKSGDFSDKGDLLNRYYKATSSNAGMAITKLGADEQQLDANLNRLTAEQVTLYERQQTVEKVDETEAAMEWKMQEYVYNAALQMGARVLQPSLWNFVN